jgi:hypothetical protein
METPVQIVKAGASNAVLLRLATVFFIASLRFETNCLLAQRPQPPKQEIS